MPSLTKRTLAKADLLARDADETRKAFSPSLLTRCQNKDRKCLRSMLTHHYDIDFLSAHQLSLLAHTSSALLTGAAHARLNGITPADGAATCTSISIGI